MSYPWAGSLKAGTAFDPGTTMARDPVIWFYLYGIIIPVAIIVAVLATGFPGILIIMGALVWMGFSITMLNPKAD